MRLSGRKALPARHSRIRQPGTTLQLPVMCSSHALSQLSFSRNPLILHLSLSLHQLNTKPNTIKSHKIQGTKLEQLQHFLSWNKANIKRSCKSQLYSVKLQICKSSCLHSMATRIISIGHLQEAMDICFDTDILIFPY